MAGSNPAPPPAETITHTRTHAHPAPPWMMARADDQALYRGRHLQHLQPRQEELTAGLPVFLTPESRDDTLEPRSFKIISNLQHRRRDAAKWTVEMQEWIP